MAAGLAGLRLISGQLERERAGPGRLWSVLVALGPPFLMLFYLGQMTGPCFLAYCLGRRSLPRRPWLAGLCFSLMAAKPHLALLALPALATGGLAAAVPFALGLLAWPLGSLALYGPAGLTDFVAQLLQVRDSNEGLLGVALSDLLPLTGAAHSAAQVAALALCALVAVAHWRRRHGPGAEPASLDVAAAALLALLPYARLYDLLFAVPLLLRLGRGRPASTRALLLGWWALPAAGLALLSHGGGGLPSLLAPAAVGLWWLNARREGQPEKGKDLFPVRLAPPFSLRRPLSTPNLDGMQTAHREQRGVALVEFAMAAPIFFFLLLVAFQVALTAMQSYSVRHVTRETARWLAINPDTTDAALLARAQAIAMPAMDTTGFVRVTATPACPSLSGGRCTGRAPGDVVTVEIVYDLTRSLFLPTTFGIGAMSVTFPTQLAPYRVSVLVE
jgi:hypothetical protein